MKNKLTILMLSLLMAMPMMAQFTSAPAFPGAEGHGRYVTGGRGGNVIHVTNLNDSGTGSFRAAVSGSSKKIVVFDVGGVIALESDLTIGANTTVLGQTAPSPGITLRYYTVRPSANNIIRYIRIRRGQEKDVNEGADATWQRQVTGLILDHCSFSWSIDEVASFYDNNNFTMQWCTIGEALNNAGHGKGAHGYGGIWGGKLASFHHNMLIHLNNRVPRFNGARYNWGGYTGNLLYSQYNWENAVQAENVDFRNCVMYNWGNGNGCYGGPGGGQINIVNNYYKKGPATGNKTRVTQISKGESGNMGDDKTYMDMTSRYYINGNYVTAASSKENYDWNGVIYDQKSYELNGEYYCPDPNNYYGNGVAHTTVNGTSCVKIKMDEPAPQGYVSTHSATTAYTKVLDYAGASLYRDNVDERYAREIKNDNPEYTGSTSGKEGIIDLVSDVNGYTEANFGTGSRPADFDTDNDGIPDAWETAHGLTVGEDNSTTKILDTKKGFYTDLEVYANYLVQHITKAERAGARDSFEEYYPLEDEPAGGNDDDDDVEGELFSLTMTATSNVSVNYGEDESLSSHATIKGGSAVVHNGHESKNATMITSNGVTLVNSGNSYIKITLDVPLKEGDVITTTGGDGGLVGLASSNADNDNISNNSFTFTSGYEDKNIIYISRGHSKPTLSAIRITRGSAAQPTLYTVTFNANGHGTCATTSLKEETEGAGVTLPTATPEDGYNFLGWATTSTATTAQYAAGANYKPSDDVTLYAVWEATPANPQGEGTISLGSGSGNSYTNTVSNVSVTVTRTSGNVTWGDNGRGFRWQQNGVITVSAPSGYHATSVKFVSNSQGNNVDKMANNINVKADGLLLQEWSEISAKADSYPWTNNVGQFNPISFTNITTGDIYVAEVVVTYEADTETSSISEDDDHESFNAGRYSTVTLKRTFPAGKWTTLVLPFAISEDQVTEVFGNDAAVAVIDRIENDRLYYTTASEIGANEPVLIKVDADNVTASNTYTFSDVTIINGTAVTEGTGVRMVGVYKVIHNAVTKELGANDYFVNNDLFYDCTYLRDMKPFRAYITPTVSGAKITNVSMDDDVVTEIKTISISDGNSAMYNIMGQRVNAGAKGIVIRNGKKVIIK